MIRAAFYAPMKSPTHPVASGDREVARALMAALQQSDVRVDLASDVSTRDGKGERSSQQKIHKVAQAEIARLIPLGRASGWQVWVTYHNYYKAPDLIGPVVAQALNIPYLQVESTRARKRLSGPWADFARAAEAATDVANTVFYLTERDAKALREHGAPDQRLVHLRPFLAKAALPPETDRTGCMLSVGMFRTGDKLASYDLISQTLKHLRTRQWHLDIAGDGPARAEVAALMAPFGKRVRMLGALAPAALQKRYQTARILVWPGVNEAFGMTYLEAQAAGLTVVGQDRPGVRDVLAPGSSYPLPAAGATALAGRLDLLLSAPKLSLKLGQQARCYVGKYHLIGPAREKLCATLNRVVQ